MRMCWKAEMSALLAMCALAAGLPAEEAKPKAPEVSKEPKEPSAKEQLFVYLLNKARSDPPAYGASINLDLKDVAPAQPFAVNKTLMASADFRAHDMFKRGYFGHVDPDGMGPNQRVLQAGYPLARIYSREAGVNNLEAISAGTESPAKTLEQLIVDRGISDLSHRNHLLNILPFTHPMREIGVGYFEPGPQDKGGLNGVPYKSFCAVHTAHADTRDIFVTGVVYDDKNHNNAYDEGEGLEGATVVIGAQSTTTLKAGGYALVVKAGAQVVGCHKGTFQGQATANIVVDSRNVHIEFISGKKDGVVNFGKPIPALTAGR